VALGTTRLDEGGAEAPFAVEGDRRNPAALEVAAALQEGFALAIGEHRRGLGIGVLVRARHRESVVRTAPGFLRRRDAGQAQQDRHNPAHHQCHFWSVVI